MQRQQLQGRRGLIETKQQGDRLIATKRAKETGVKGAINKERDIILLLNDRGVNFVPQITDHGDGWFSYERIDGEHFRDTRKRATDDVTKLNLARKLYTAAYTLDKAGVVHGELLRPTKNVLFTPQGTIGIIDFERGKLGDDSGKNMKAIAQRMSRQGIVPLSITKSLGAMKREAIRKTIQPYIQQPTQLKRLIALGVDLVILDLITKWLFYNQEYGAEYRLLTPMFNPGIGWSIPVPLYFVIVITSLICVLLGRMIREKHIHRRGGMFLLAGAIGNLIDRVLYSGVRDFIDFHYRPIFNGADIFVTIGAGLIIYYEFFRKK